MKRTFVLGLLVGALIAVGVAWAAGPADFTYDQGKGSPGKVTFSHTAHEKTGKACPDCHQNGDFKVMKKAGNGLNMTEINAGKFCGKCHTADAAKGPKRTDCVGCHKK